MSLTVPQLEELQAISVGIQDLYPDNSNDQWWAAIRILNAGLGPVTTSPAAFAAVLADILLTQQQIQPYQGRLAAQETGFREAVLQVVPVSGGGGASIYTADGSVGAGARRVVTIPSDASLDLGGGDESIIIDGAGSITINSAAQLVSIIDPSSGEAGLPAFDDDADASSLNEGTLYQTTGAGAAPLNAPGIVMMKQSGI